MVAETQGFEFLTLRFRRWALDIVADPNGGRASTDVSSGVHPQTQTGVTNLIDPFLIFSLFLTRKKANQLAGSQDYSST